MSLKNTLVKLLLQRKYKKDLDITQVKRVLIIRNSGIGDAVCLEPMLREFKKAFPAIEIDIFASLGNYIVFKNSKYVSNVYVRQKKRYWIKRVVEFFKIKQRKHELLIDTTNYHFNKALMSYFLNPKWAIAVENNQNFIMNRSNLSFYNKCLAIKEYEHVVDKLLRFINLLGIDKYNNSMSLDIPNTSLQKAQKFIETFKGKKVVAINIFAQNKDRTLSYEQLVQLCLILQVHDIEILLFFTLDKKSKLEKIIDENAFTNIHLTYDTKSIFDAMALVSCVDLIISPDTAYIHIASALNKPMIGLFWNNKQQIAEWGPRSDIFKVITSKIKDDNNLNNIDLKEISSEVKNILNLKSKT